MCAVAQIWFPDVPLGGAPAWLPRLLTSVVSRVLCPEWSRSATAAPVPPGVIASCRWPIGRAGSLDMHGVAGSIPGSVTRYFPPCPVWVRVQPVLSCSLAQRSSRGRVHLLVPHVISDHDTARRYVTSGLTRDIIFHYYATAAAVPVFSYYRG